MKQGTSRMDFKRRGFFVLHERKKLKQTAQMWNVVRIAWSKCGPSDSLRRIYHGAERELSQLIQSFSLAEEGAKTKDVAGARALTEPSLVQVCSLWPRTPFPLQRTALGVRCLDSSNSVMGALSLRCNSGQVQRKSTGKIIEVERNSP